MKLPNNNNNNNSNIYFNAIMIYVPAGWTLFCIELRDLISTSFSK